MKLRAIAMIGLLFVLAIAANAQTTRADLPAPDNFLDIATFPLWDGDGPEAKGTTPADIPRLTFFVSQTDLGRFGLEKLQSIESDLAKVPIPR